MPFLSLHYSSEVLAQAHLENIRGAGLKAWPFKPPATIPFAASKELTGIGFTGRRAQYSHADTWYPSWATNGNPYPHWTNGEVNGVESTSWGAPTRTGYATIIGNDPIELKNADVSTCAAGPAPMQDPTQPATWLIEECGITGRIVCGRRLKSI